MIGEANNMDEKQKLLDTVERICGPLAYEDMKDKRLLRIARWAECMPWKTWKEASDIVDKYDAHDEKIRRIVKDEPHLIEIDLGEG